MTAPPLDDLAAFATVARTRNFRRAALELGISASSLSQRTRELEARLGVRLLNRTTRSVAPTEAGERLFTRLVPALRDVSDATLEVQSMRDRPSGRLRINGPEPALRWALAPLVGPFLRRCPDVALEIVADSSLIDIVSAGFDAGIRYEERLAQDMIAVPLGAPERYVLVASPAFLSARRKPRSPRELPGQPCIVTRFRSGFVLPWEFRRGSRTLKFVPTGPLVASHPELQLRAAVDGVGYLMTLEAYARHALDAGELVTLFEDWCPPSPGPYLYYPGRRQTPPALAAFVAYVKETWNAGSPMSPSRPLAAPRSPRSPRRGSR
jgi:DNA-binding transcriptional LysR family regulator